METKYVFVTGGVLSSVGKGVTAAALGRLLIERGFKVSVQKLDPYINVDPGTMSPYQHGAVYVLDDGSETDLDLGHYERFLNINLTKVCKLHFVNNSSLIRVFTPSPNKVPSGNTTPARPFFFSNLIIRAKNKSAVSLV